MSARRDFMYLKRGVKEFRKEVRLRRLLDLYIQRIVVFFVIFFSVLIFTGGFLLGKDNHFSTNMTEEQYFLLLSSAVIILALLLYFAYRVIDKLSKRQLLVTSGVLFVVMLGIFFFMLKNFRTLAVTDSQAMIDISLYMSKHGGKIDFSTEEYVNYLNMYGNNYFLILAFSRIYKVLTILNINDPYLPMYVLQAAAVITGVVFTYLTAMKIRGIRTATKVLLLCLLNPINYVIIFWIYSNTLSIPFMMEVLYFGICLYFSNKMLKTVVLSIIEAILIAVSYFVRPTSIIPFIALVICAFMLMLKQGKVLLKKFIVPTLVMLVTVIMCFKFISMDNQSYFSKVSDKNFPITHWTMMASHGDGEYNESDVDFTTNIEGKSAKRNATLERTISNYKELGVLGTIKLFGNKTISTWSNGYSDLNGRLAPEGKYTKSFQLIAGDQRDFFQLYCDAFRILTFLLVAAAGLCIIKKKEFSGYEFILNLSLLGGIVFYCIWEVKSVYSVPFLLLIFLIGAEGLDVIGKKIAVLQKEKIKRYDKFMPWIILFLGMVLLLCTELCGIMSRNIYHREYSLRSYTVWPEGEISHDKGEKFKILQEFNASKPFNNICLNVEVVEKEREDTDRCVYKIELMDQNKKVLHTRMVNSDYVNLQYSYIFLTLDEEQSEAPGKYYLKIKKISGTENAINFVYRKSLYLKDYKGRCRVNGKKKNYQVSMQVYNAYIGPYSTKVKAVIICAGIFVMSAILCGLFLRLVTRPMSKPLSEQKSDKGEHE